MPVSQHRAFGGTTRLEVAHVLFMDLVGYSRLTVEDQGRGIATLQESVRETSAYVEARAKSRVLAHPAGDCMALAFFGHPSRPACRALEAGQTARRAGLTLRVGFHLGPWMTPSRRPASTSASPNPPSRSQRPARS